MSQTKSFLLLAGAALSLSGVNATLAQQSSDEVRAVVAEMLNDADSRSSLLADAGHDSKGFNISGEGFTLRVGGQIQFRYLMNFRDDENTVGARAGDDFESGFQTRRTKLWFHGNIINEHWKYKLVGAFNKGSGAFELEDAYVSYDFSNGFYAKWGQFKAPFLHEETVSDSKQLAVERSIANAIFNQDWSQGVELGYKADAWKFQAAFTDGLATRNTDFTSDAESDWALTGRAEFLIKGKWDQFEDFTSRQGGDFGALVGAAVHYQDSANSANPGDVDQQYLGYTADASLEGDGWNGYAAFMGRHVDSRGPVGAGDNPDFDDFGLVVQAGVYVAADTEIFARWDAVFLDEDRVADGDDNFHFLTVGLNQYYAGHAANASVDVVYAFNETTNLVGASALANQGFPSTSSGLLGDSKDGEVVVRLQFQLLF